MNKSVEDLVEKVRQYAEDPTEQDPNKPRRPLTGYYADSDGTERPLHLPVNDRGHLANESSVGRNSLPRMKKRTNSEALSEKSKSMEDLSSSSSREILEEVNYVIYTVSQVHSLQ